MCWLTANTAFYIIIMRFAVDDQENIEYKDGEVQNSEDSFLAVVSISLAFLVIFRLVFATLYICKWRCKYNLDSKFKVPTRSLVSDFRAIKKKHAADGDSTEDEYIK